MSLKEDGLNHGPTQLQSSQIEGSEMTVEQIKADLRMRCEQIPFALWIRYGELTKKSSLELNGYFDSSLLPAEGSHDFMANEILFL